MLVAKGVWVPRGGVGEGTGGLVIVRSFGPLARARSAGLTGAWPLLSGVLPSPGGDVGSLSGTALPSRADGFGSPSTREVDEGSDGDEPPVRRASSSSISRR